MNSVFEIALEIAVKAHKGQVDKNGVAYILHPLAVAGLLNSLELKTIAVLHDTIEDTDVTAEYLLEKGIPKYIVEAIYTIYERYIAEVDYEVSFLWK